MNRAAEKGLVNLSSSPQKKMQSKGKSCYIDDLWPDPLLTTAMEKIINQKYIVVKVNYLAISKGLKTMLVLMLMLHTYSYNIYYFMVTYALTTAC